MSIFAKLKTLIVDPVEDGICVIRTMGLIGAVEWAIGGAKIALSQHPHLRQIGESLGITATSIAAAIRIKRPKA